MRIAETLVFQGPNIWSRNPALEIRLLTDGQSDAAGSISHCCDRINNWYRAAPALHAAAEFQRSQFRDRLAQARHSIDLFAATVIELQTLAGTTVENSWVEADEPALAASVAVEFVEEPIARLAVEMAIRLVGDAPTGPMPDFDECLRELRECAERSCFGGTTGPIVEAARRRGIPVTRLDGDCLVQLGHGARQRRIMGSNTNRTGFLAEAISRDKSLTKQLMRQLGIPVPPGRLVADAADAWAAACELGLPVVVKPRDEDCGIGVSLMLRTQAQVAQAYARARECRPDVLVERHLPGAPHRLFVVNDRLVAAVRRDPAQVCGDGRQTIAELVALANRDPRRGDGPADAWFPIVVDDEAEATLADQQFELNSIPPAGQRVLLRYDPKQGYGGTLEEVTESVHAETARAVFDAVRVTGLDVAGVDVMAVDITLPLAAQGGGILEVNGGPAIYLHRSPFCEPGRPVAEAIVESLLPFDESGRIPIVAVLGNERAIDVATRTAEMLAATELTVGLATANGIRVGGHELQNALVANDAHRCRALLLHPRVELAVCDVSLTSLRDEGLAFEECQIAVLAARPTAPESGPAGAIPERCLRVLLNCVSADGTVIVNMDDPWLASLFTPGDERLLATALDASHRFLARHRECGGATAFIEDGEAVMTCGDRIAMRRLLPASSCFAAAHEPDIAWLLACAVAASCQLAELPTRQYVEHSTGCNARLVAVDQFDPGWGRRD
jgi:cyanophycin synthetase